ncbi:MAG: MBL fold metallo-hydrolase [Solirubrobacteraceae bacterium]
MSPIRLTFIGCGDAFSSGGRLHTCFYLQGGEEPMLVDCGATSLAGLKRERIDPASIGSVAVSHLHGDHFAGLAWIVIEGRIGKRDKPLVIGGPPTTQERLRRASEALYPGSGDADTPFEIHHVEFSEGTRCEVGPSVVTPFEVIHSSGVPSYALRVEYGGRVVAYSGDTEWTDNLIDAARGADLFICECNFFDRRVAGHLDYRTIIGKRSKFGCKRLVLTHMGDAVLARLSELDIETAADGLTIEV